MVQVAAFGQQPTPERGKYRPDQDRPADHLRHPSRRGANSARQGKLKLNSFVHGIFFFISGPYRICGGNFGIS
jgi:hypothetical protein